MAGGVYPRLQPKQSRKRLRRRCDRRCFGSPPLSENEKYFPSPRNFPPSASLPKAGEVVRRLFFSARLPLLPPGVRTIRQPSELPLLSGRHIWLAKFPGTFDNHLRFAADHHP